MAESLRPEALLIIRRQDGAPGTEVLEPLYTSEWQTFESKGPVERPTNSKSVEFSCGDAGEGSRWALSGISPLESGRTGDRLAETMEEISG